jgi:hypothetical protein
MHICTVITTLAIALPAIYLPLFIVIRLRGILEIYQAFRNKPGFFVQSAMRITAAIK